MHTRNGMYAKIQTYSFYEVDQMSPGSLVTRLSNDVQRYQLNMQMILTMLFRAPVTITISIINAFTPPLGNITYGLIVIGIVVVMLIVVSAFGLRALPMFTKAQSQLDATNSVMRENILGSRVIKTFNIQDNQLERYDAHNKELKRLNIRGQALLLPIMIVIQFLLNTGVIAILIVAGILFVDSPSHPEINSGIFAFTQIIVIVLFSTLLAIMVIVNTTRTMASIKRINAVFDTKPSIVEKSATIPFNKDFAVKFNKVKFKYNRDAKAYALDDISFEIKSGQTLGIVGGTGSGKSTIANLIPRFYDVNQGEITIGGVNIKDVKLDDLHDVVGVVLQESILFYGTIASNLQFGKIDATETEMIRACEHSCAWDFVQALPNKLQSRVEQRGRNFSGGQKQRLAIARTLIKNPKILIFDDTTSALDLLTEAKVQQNISKYYADATKIIVSQRVSSVKNADHILVIENGKVIGQGKHDELIKTNDVYHQIVLTQLGQEGMN
jgi:ATP-binding cassette subfamily B protein